MNYNYYCGYFISKLRSAVLPAAINPPNLSTPLMAKKKSLWLRAAGFLYDALKWLAQHAFSLLQWLAVSIWTLLNWLFRQSKEAARTAKAAHAESKRPQHAPEFSSLNPVETLDGDLAAFEDHVYSKKSSIGIILGARGSGKSALGMRILENVAHKTGRKVYAIGFDRLTLPKWLNAVPAEQINAVPNGSFLLVDEGGITFSSRSSMSDANKLLTSLLLISRHKDLSVLFISQNSSNLEINAIRQTDYLLLKPPSLLQKDFERKVIQDIYAEQAAKFKALGKAHVGLFYVHSDAFRGFAENGLPSFWSEGVSKAYKLKQND